MLDWDKELMSAQLLRRDTYRLIAKKAHAFRRVDELAT